MIWYSTPLFIRLALFILDLQTTGKKLIPHPIFPPNFYWRQSHFLIGTSSTLPFGIEYNKFLSQYYKKWRLLVFKILTKIHTLYINIFSRLLYKQWDLEFRNFLIYPKRVLNGGIAVYVVCAHERYFFLLILNLISLSLLTK